MLRHPHLPPEHAPGNFALHSSTHASTRTYAVPRTNVGLSPGAAPPPHLQLALTTTVTLLASCHILALSASAIRLAAAPLALAPLALLAPGSALHVPAGSFPFPQRRLEPPTHRHGSSPASADVVPPL